MYGRFTLTMLPENLLEYLSLDEYPDYKLRYNIAPTQQIPVFFKDNVTGKCIMKMFHCGLIPFWVKEIKIS
jgi:putative SOS response-associated peptidase YedK